MGRCTPRRSTRLTLLAAALSLGAAACADDLTQVPPPPPPGLPTLVLSATSRHTAILVGDAAPADSVTLAITGEGSDEVAWTATAGQSRTSVTPAAGAGSGVIRWTRQATGLGAGVYVDTITVAFPNQDLSPLRIVDTIQITTAPIPLALVLADSGRRRSVPEGTALSEDSVEVRVQGTGAAAATWTASARRPTTTLVAAQGTGTGLLRWTRGAAALAVGLHIDTLTVTLPGVAGSPARLIDTLEVTAVGPPPGVRPDLGVNASMNGWRPFPDDDPWNTPVDQAETDPNSLAILTDVGLDKRLHPDFGANWNGGPFGIPYVVVPDDTPRWPVVFQYAGESDVGPYPIPPNPPIEGNGEGDAHILIITRDERKLYELFYAHPSPSGWTAGSGAIFDLIRGTQRPAYWTSADAAGLPIFPGLVRYDEVYGQGEIRHALRFTVTRSRRAYVPPATHWASTSTDPNRPPMGMRVRLKASVDISGYPEKAQVILRALKKYGMIVADNGGDFFISGAPDARWNDEVNNTLKQIRVRDFEVVKMVGVVTP